MKRNSFIVLVCILLSTPVSATAGRGVDNCNGEFPIIAAVRADNPPTIDGRLDDPVWGLAPMLDDFYVTDLDRGPTERTILWLAYDDEYIYYAARLFDSQPGDLRMEQTRRGGDVQNDDYLAVGFDILNQHARGCEYVFRVNPLGTQDEKIPDGAAGKIEWRGDWHAAAQVDSLGWTVEAAVPFSMFRRSGGVATVGVTAYRWHPRTHEASQWPNMGRNWDRTKAGDWVGVVWPEPESRPVFMPYVVAEYEGGKPAAYAGADVKYVAPVGLTFQATIYPDFQNVESDILGLDFSYTEKGKDDARPFFDEGRRFLPEDWMFYTNRIEEMYGGAKVFGQVGRHRFGLLEAYDRDKVNHLAGQYEWWPVDGWELENKFAYRHGDPALVDPEYGPPLENNFIGVSELWGRWQRGPFEHSLRLQGGFTQSDGTVADGWNLEGSYTRDPDIEGFGFETYLRALEEGFVSIDGLLDEEDLDQREIRGEVWYEAEYDRRFWRSWELGTETRYAERFNGDLYVRNSDVWLWAEVFPGTHLTVEFDDEERPPHHDRTGLFELGWMQDRLYTSGSAGTKLGKIEGGDYLLTWMEQNTHPLENLMLGAGIEWLHRDLPFGHEDKPAGGVVREWQLIGTGQFDITAERAVSGRIIHTQDHTNGYVTFQQVMRRGMDLYLIFGDPSSEEGWVNRVALKAVIVL